MRKYSALAAVVLALAAASSVLAAQPATLPAPAATSAPASQHWTTAFSSDPIRVRARLFAASEYRFGWLAVQVRGLTRTATVEVILADGTKSTAILDVTRTVRSHHGVRSFLVRLNASQAAALKAAVGAKDAITLTVKSGSVTATGTFAPPKS